MVKKKSISSLIFKKNICIVGLGYVGLPLLKLFSSKFNVTGFDNNKLRIKELKKKFKSKKKIGFYSKIEDVPSTQIYIITVPTPVDNNNIPDLSSLKNASRLVGKRLNNEDIVIYESTVYPGTTTKECVPILEKYSGLKCKFNNNPKNNKKIFYVGYSPERISPGDKKKLHEIVKVTSGSNRYASKLIDQLYKKIIKAGTYNVENIEIGEASKIVENIQRDTNLALINQISLILHRMDINPNKVINASNTKWNFHYYTPGLVGGHCIAIDPYYMIYSSKKKKISSSIINLSRRINNAMSKEVSKLIDEKLKKIMSIPSKTTIAILGSSFKENIDDIRNSKIFDLYSNLKSMGYRVKLTDKIVDKKKVLREKSIKIWPIEKIKDADLIFLGVAHKYFIDLKVSDFKKMFNNKKKEKYIFDFKNILEGKNRMFESNGIKIMTL